MDFVIVTGGRGMEVEQLPKHSSLLSQLKLPFETYRDRHVLSGCCGKRSESCGQQPTTSSSHLKQLQHHDIQCSEAW